MGCDVADAQPLAPHADATPVAVELGDLSANRGAHGDLFGFTSTRVAGVHVPKARAERYFPFLPDEDPARSLSVGSVTDGYVINSVPLALPGATYAVLPRQLRRGLIWATEDTIHTLVYASEFVARARPGTVSWLGNIGQRGGGDIAWSVSHNSGRDADISFFALDPSGEPVVPPDLLHYGGNRRSREYGGYYRFDADRTWLYVEGLIRAPYTDIEFIFISHPLRDLVLAAGERAGADPDILAAARRVLVQPGGALPHDDHLHLRVYCSRADVTAGCDERIAQGRFAEVRAAREQVALAMLVAPEAETRARAIERLALLGVASALPSIRARLDDPSSRVRGAAVVALAELGGSAQGAWIVEHWEDETDDVVRERMLHAIGRLGGAAAGQLLADLLRAPLEATVGGKAGDLRVAVADAAGESGRAETLGALIEVLADADPEVRGRAADGLRLLVNRDVISFDWRDGGRSREEIERARSAWQAWRASHGTATRASWLNGGFADAGYGGSAATAPSLGDLARAARDERRWISRNAQRELMRRTGHFVRSLEWSGSDAGWYWQRWISRNAGGD
jgi:penicillin-insensitive murein endopeptidase